jgi:formamidopyrimidine-DNA glycosylase
MPEMPEVETIARRLRGVLPGKRIEAVTLSGLPLRRPIAVDFAAALRGRTVREIHRRGKYLIAELDPLAYWVIHLGMTGRLIYASAPSQYPRHTHAVIRFSDSTELQYSDHRRFGLLCTHPVATLAEVPELKSLGKDPLERGFGTRWMKPLLRNSRQEIKSFLLDQRRIAGIGNIYACEALFHAGIRPSRRCHTLRDSEIDRLASAVRKVLRAAIRHRGTSFSDYIDSDGLPGTHQTFLQVFQREGEACRRCGSRIRRLRQGNRSSFYCSRCQR